MRNLQFLSHLAPVGTAAVAACNFETQVQFRLLLLLLLLLGMKKKIVEA